MSLPYYWHRIKHYFEANRNLAAALCAAVIVFGFDILFHHTLFSLYQQSFESLFHAPLGTEHAVDLGYAPEVWLALIAMVLGTLIIVISIASQSIPKLIDLYMQDWMSLLYIWFLVMSILHAVGILIYSSFGYSRVSSEFLNLHVYLGLSLLLAFPYVFYILKRTKPSEVIWQIFQTNRRQIKRLPSKHYRVLFQAPDIVEEVQFELFEALNQLADLLEYVNFKEPKAEIIQNMSQLIQTYIPLKSKVSPSFFQVSQKVHSDISFKTMIDQFEEMQTTQTFYEQKCFRVLGNIYIHLLESKDFELSSLCASELTNIAKVALQANDDDLLNVIIVRFNTTLRFAIKHGVAQNEPRNLYNATFHYGTFVKELAQYNKLDLLKRSFFYLRIYGTEIFKHGKNSPAMYFIVDVFTAEMKKILILAHKNQLPFDIQKELLFELLQIDSPPDMTRESLDRGQLMNNGVRVLQMGLGLYYLKEGVDEFVDAIIDDVLDDLSVLGEETFRTVIENTCNRLKFSGPSFWEDTDRGSLNIYYTPNEPQIEPFKQRLYEKIKTFT